VIFQIPINSVIVGACWAQFVASGPKYSDMNNPQVMIKVGNVGDVGNIEIQDVLFTVKGATQGAVLLEWNAKAATQGSVAMWGNYNSYFLWSESLTCQYRLPLPRWWSTRDKSSSSSMPDFIKEHSLHCCIALFPRHLWSKRVLREHLGLDSRS
jgi:hypothetical protein